MPRLSEPVRLIRVRPSMAKKTAIMRLRVNFSLKKKGESNMAKSGPQ